MMGIGLIASGLLIPAGPEVDGFFWLGEQAYLALAGLALVLAWAVNRLNRPAFKHLLVAGLALLICIFGVLVRRELNHWQTWDRFLARQSMYSPGDYRFKLWRGKELINMDRLDEAEKELRAVLSLHPDLAQPHLYMGVIRQVQRRFQEAINHFRLALERDPNLGEAHNGWAGTLLNMGLPIEAAVHYTKAVAIKPDPSWYNNLGQVLEKLGRTQEALHAYEQAEACSNGHPVPLNNLAVVLYRMGRYQEAKIKLEAALAKQPDFVEAKENLANINHALKNRD
jgi:tetratricopeptide (TPR) repeat protein